MIDFDAKAAEYVRMRKVHSSQKLAAIGGGGVRLTMTCRQLEPGRVLGVGVGRARQSRGAEELAVRVREELEGALALYAGPKRARKTTKK